MLKIILPNFYENNDLNSRVIELLDKEPHLFYDNIHIEAEEGGFPYTFWDGSGVNYLPPTRIPLENASPFELIQAETWSHKTKIGIDISNIYLKLEDIKYNTSLDTILNLFHDGSNYLIISNLDFIPVIQEKYPNYYFVGSLTSPIEDSLIRKKILLSDLEEYKNVPKNKIEVVTSIKCGKCPSYKECFKKEHYSNYLMSQNSYCNSCDIIIDNSEDSSIVPFLVKSNYQYLSINNLGIAKNNLSSFIIYYAKLLAKPENFYQVLYELSEVK